MLTVLGYLLSITDGLNLMESLQDDNHFYVLVTGANSGLGFSICRRLIDEFLHTRPQSHILHVLPTVRSRSKATETTTRLRAHIGATLSTYERTTPGISRLLEPRIKIQPELVDLSDLVSVRLCSRRLLNDGGVPKLDAVICNAGVGGWSGLNWPLAVWKIMTDIVEATTRPTYKLGIVGSVVPKLGDKYGQKDEQEPPLGEIFAANLFGHYMLGHDLAPLLARGQQGQGGRLIWLGSTEADAAAFDAHVDDDIQNLKNDISYENIKRLTEVLALTSHLPSTRPWVDTYWSADSTALQTPRSSASLPQICIAHPGIVGTNIFPLPLILSYCVMFATWLARVFGSIWHPITPYKGAVAPVWVALASPETLESIEAETADGMSGGKGKWGSAADVWGEERVERTEVTGWGYGGRVVERPIGRRKGRWRDAIDLTKERREEFEEVGRKCWRAMEELRVQWEGRVDEIVRRLDKQE